MKEKSRYDKLVYLTRNVEFRELSELDTEELTCKVQEMFPEFDPSNPRNDDSLSDFIVEQYTYCRSVGMSAEEAAFAAEVSSLFMDECLEGIGLSLERLVYLAKAELFAFAQFRKKQLTVLAKASEEGSSKAAITLMEKLWPEFYADKPMSVNNNFFAGDGDGIKVVFVDHADQAAFPEEAQE